MRLWQSLCSLSALGHEVHVLVCDPRNDPSPELVRVSSSVTTLRSDNMVPGTRRWLLSHVFNPSSVALAYPDLGGLRRSVTRAIDETIARYSVDQDRITVTGHSMGGEGTTLYAPLHADRIAAIAPSAGSAIIVPENLVDDNPFELLDYHEQAIGRNRRARGEFKADAGQTPSGQRHLCVGNVTQFDKLRARNFPRSFTAFLYGYGYVALLMQH